MVEIFATRMVGKEVRLQHNELTGPIFSIVGVTHGVLLALVAMLAWETYNAAEAATDGEARLADVASLALGAPEPARASLRADLRAYAEVVQGVEWPAQAAAHVASAGDQALGRADAIVLALQPTDAVGTNVQATLLHRLLRRRDARELRTWGIPAIVWFVVIAGGAISLAFASLLGAWSRALHLVLGALLALSGTLVLVMVVSPSHPFRGELRVTPKPFTAALASTQT